MRAIEVGSPYASPDVDLIVAHAHSLRTLSLFKLNATRIPGLVCHFPRLRHLSLQGDAEGNGAFLKALSAPALAQLDVRSLTKEADALAPHIARLRGLRNLVVSLTDQERLSAPSLVAACRATGCYLSFVPLARCELESLARHPEHLDHLKLDLVQTLRDDATVALYTPHRKNYAQLQKLELTFRWHHTRLYRMGNVESNTLACAKFWEYACNLLRSNTFPCLEGYSIVAATTSYTVLNEIALTVLCRQMPKLAHN